jgi:quercetin dioxygenase-like cupin family protein
MDQLRTGFAMTQDSQIDSQRQKPQFRRVVTAHDADGKAVIWLDGDAANHKFPTDKITSTLLWSTDRTPTDLLATEDEGARILGSAPPPNGSRFTMMQFFPGNDGHMHRTDTVDYVICLSGEIDMVVDDGKSVTLRAGDVVIQRGTNHAWINRSTEPCRLAVVLIDALPKREGSISGLISAR